MKRAAIRLFAIVLIAICVPSSMSQSPSTAAAAAPSGSVIIPVGQTFVLQLDTPMHTRTTKKGAKVEFHMASDLVVENQILIPDRSLVRATVIKSKRAGMLFGRAEIQLRFDQVKLPDGTELPIQATITRAGFNPVDSKEGEDPKLKGEAGTGGDVKAIATAGAQGGLAGVIWGGARGAGYGAAAGAAVAILAGTLKRGPDIDLPRSTMFEARFDKAVEVPWASVLGMNTPKPTPPGNAADSSRELPRQEKATEEVAEEPQKTRPVLKRRPVEEPPEVASASKPEPQPAEAPAGTGTNAEAKPMDPAAGGYKLSVKVKMVQVDAVVRDRSGHNMESLRLEDFRVYEDNVLQEVASFSKDELPLAVALVVDRSGSVAPYISELRRIATRALYQLKPQDEVCLFSFAADVQRLEDLTTDRQRIADAIDRIFAGGSTDIMDALYEAIRYLAGAAPDRRHAVILVSDNQQTAHPQTTEREVITTALETEAVVYSLKTSGVPMNLTNPLPSLIFGDSVHKVAQDTGGEVINVSHVGSLDSALSGVIAKLRTRYTLGYYPSSSGQSARFHSITVRLTEKFGKAGSDYFIQAKRGYYAVGPQNNFSESSPLGR